MNAKAFAMLLSSSSHIRNLNLSNNNFGQNVEEAFAELMQNLSSNTVVQVKIMILSASSVAFSNIVCASINLGS